VKEHFWQGVTIFFENEFFLEFKPGRVGRMNNPEDSAKPILENLQGGNQISSAVAAMGFMLCGDGASLHHFIQIILFLW